MSTTKPVTADELWNMPRESERYELVAGELQMMSPAGWRHGELVFRLSLLIGQHVKQHRLGRCFGAETGFLIERNPDTVLAPDIAFIEAGNLPQSEPEDAFWPGPPDLIVEVRSPQDRKSAVIEKAERWLAAGGKTVWDVDPANHCVTVYEADGKTVVVKAEETLSGGNRLPGFQIRVGEILSETATDEP